MMGINRRRLLGGSVLMGLTASVASYQWLAQNHSTLLLSAADLSDGQHCLVGSQLDGKVRFCVPVNERAHQALVLPQSPLAIFFGRRPSPIFYLVDTNEGRLVKTVTAPEQHHFYGHGVLSADGEWLFITENDYGQTRGLVGVYRTSGTFSREGEFDSGGLGPHQIGLLPSSNLLVVANGGIETHPDSGRDELNLPTMAPNLAYLDSRTGKVVETVAPPHHQMSVRHFDITPDQTVVIGIQDHQYESDIHTANPLVLQHRRGESMKPMHCATADWASMNQYIASVAVSDNNQWALTTTPRGNLVSLWDLKNQQLVWHFPVKDVAGAMWQTALNGFVISNGLGQLIRLDAAPQPQAHILLAQDQLHWDNHLNLHNS